MTEYPPNFAFTYGRDWERGVRTCCQPSWNFGRVPGTDLGSCCPGIKRSKLSPEIIHVASVHAVQSDRGRMLAGRDQCMPGTGWMPVG